VHIVYLKEIRLRACVFWQFFAASVRTEEEKEKEEKKKKMSNFLKAYNSE